jgi:hypothetical protein
MGPHRHPGITASVFAILIYIYTRKYGVAHGTLLGARRHPGVTDSLFAILASRHHRLRFCDSNIYI